MRTTESVVASTLIEAVSLAVLKAVVPPLIGGVGVAAGGPAGGVPGAVGDRGRPGGVAGGVVLDHGTLGQQQRVAGAHRRVGDGLERLAVQRILTRCRCR